MKNNNAISFDKFKQKVDQNSEENLILDTKVNPTVVKEGHIPKSLNILAI